MMSVVEGVERKTETRNGRWEGPSDCHPLYMYMCDCKRNADETNKTERINVRTFPSKRVGLSTKECTEKV